MFVRLARGLATKSHVRLVETSCDQSYTISNANVKLAEASRDRWHQHVNKICLYGHENGILFRKVILWFSLSQKVNNNALQPKRFVNFNTFSHTFITFKNISMSHRPTMKKNFLD